MALFSGTENAGTKYKPLKKEVKMKTQTLKLITAITFCVILSGKIFAQDTAKNTTDPDYRNAIGLRAGETSGLTVKHFFGSGHAVEGILGIWPNNIGITGLYEKYLPIAGVKGLNCYFGGGAHVTFGTGNIYYTYYNE